MVFPKVQIRSRVCPFLMGVQEFSGGFRVSGVDVNLEVAQ